MRAQDVILEYVGSFVPKSAEDLEDLQSFVEQEQEDIDSASIMVDDDEDKAAKLTKDYRALTAIDYVIKNNVRAFENPELLKSNIFLYDYEQDSGQVGAIHIQLHDDIAEVKWLGSYGTSGKKLLQAGLQVAKARGAKRVKLTAKWDSEGFYRKMGLQQGASKSDPFANSNMTDFTGDINEQKITEVNMSSGALKKFLNSPFAQSAKVGFEFELVVPGLQKFNSDDDDDYEDIEKFNIEFPTTPDWEEKIITWFNASNIVTPLNKLQLAIAKFKKAYVIWEKELFDEAISNSGWLEDDLFKEIGKLQNTDNPRLINAAIRTKNHFYKQAVGKLRAEFTNSNEFSDFTDYESLYDMRDFCNKYGLTLPYDYVTTMTVKQLTANFKAATNYSARGDSEYHGLERTPNLWIFEPDASIKDSTLKGAGIELVSPPMTLNTGIVALDTVWDWTKSVGAYTNNTTGFHMNVSIPYKTFESMDYLKMILFLGDQHILKTFGRESNSYATSMTEVLAKQAKNLKNRDKNFAKTLTTLRSGINNLAKRSFTRTLTSTNDRYVTVNIKDEYIEFRAAGGNYLDKKDEILVTLARYIKAMSIASDPEAEKQEYAKKLYKFMSTFMSGQKDKLDIFVKYAAGEVTQQQLKLYFKQREIDILHKQLQAKRAALRQAHREINGPRPRNRINPRRGRRR